MQPYKICIFEGREGSCNRSFTCRSSQSQRFLHRKHLGCRSSSCKHHGKLHVCKETTNFCTDMLHRLDVTILSLHISICMLILRHSTKNHSILPHLTCEDCRFNNMWHLKRLKKLCLYLYWWHVASPLTLKMPWQKKKQKTFIIQTCCDLIQLDFLFAEKSHGFSSTHGRSYWRCVHGSSWTHPLHRGGKSTPQRCVLKTCERNTPWEPTFPSLLGVIDLKIAGSKPSFFMVLGSKGW